MKKFFRNISFSFATEFIVKIYLMGLALTFVGMGIFKTEFFMNAYALYVHSMAYLSGAGLIIFIGFVLFSSEEAKDRWIMGG